jgi:hypothetical protein
MTQAVTHSHNLVRTNHAEGAPFTPISHFMKTKAHRDSNTALPFESLFVLNNIIEFLQFVFQVTNKCFIYFFQDL